MERRYRNRHAAGVRLAGLLEGVRSEDPVVVGLPRGGVPVAAVVAETLGAPLDVIVVRKLGVPFQPEVGMGAVGEGGVVVVDDETVRLARVTPAELADVEEREAATVADRVARFRRHRDAVPLAGRTVVVVDDGIATGGTARAAVQIARARGARRVVLAVPVAPPDVVRSLATVADEVVCPETPAPFTAVGQWYADFAPVSDDEVVQLLDRAARAPEGESRRGRSAPFDGDVVFVTRSARLPGHLAVPEGASGVVVFAHGSGSSRHSPRNRFVADSLRSVGLATVLLDLLTPAEEADRANVFDVELLADRLVDVVDRIRDHPATRGLAVGLFGASTGAAAALVAASRQGAAIGAVVSRGGRPDLAADHLATVTAPTLLIVGGRDRAVLDLNRWAGARLGAACRLEVVSGATHLFAEPGALAAVATLAGEWFTGHLRGPGAAHAGSTDGTVGVSDPSSVRNRSATAVGSNGW